MSRSSQTAHTTGVDVLDDTAPDAQRVFLELARSATTDERLRLAFGLSDLVRRLAVGQILQQNPEASATDIQRELARRLLDPRLARAVIGRIDGRCP